MTCYKKTGLFILSMIILSLISAFFITAAAVSQTHITQRAGVQYQRKQEQQYVKELRLYLKNRGYENSGVNLTRTTESDGSVSYTAAIHHAGIDRLDDRQKEELLSLLADLPSPREDADISHTFF